MPNSLPSEHLPQAIARRLAAFALPGADAEQVPAEPIVVREIDWPAVRANVEFQRLTGLALAALSENALELPSGASEELEASHRRAMAWALAVERATLRVHDALAEEGIQGIVLKGSAFAHGFYPDPSWRPFGDLDLMVRGDDLARTGAVLEKLGSARTLPEPREGFDRRFGTGAIYRTTGGIEIDLHRTLVIGPFGLWIRPDELFDTTERFDLGGRSLLRLEATAAFIHACVHAALGALPPLLMPLRDLVQIAHTGRPDWERVQTLAARWHLGPVVGHALTTASQVLGAPAVPAAMPLLENGWPRRERRALRAYTTERQRRGARAIATLQAIPGVRGKVAYVRALGVPNREFLAARQASDRGSYARRLAVPLRWLIRKP
jgi:hypothetical protein